MSKRLSLRKIRKPNLVGASLKETFKTSNAGSIKSSVNHQLTVSQPSANHQLTVSQPSAKPSAKIDLNLLTGKKLIFLNFIMEQCRISGELETNPVYAQNVVGILKK